MVEVARSPSPPTSTYLAGFYRQRSAQRRVDVRSLREHDVDIPRLVRHRGARRATDHATDDGALAALPEHPSEDRSRGRAGADLRRVRPGHAPTLGDRLERVDARVDRVI